MYRDLHFPTRAHSSTACCSVPPSWPAGLPRPLHCTHLPPHTTHHSPLTTPHRARTTFGFECHASCPSLSPCPPPAARFLGRPCSHPAHEPCPCPRFLLLSLVVPLPLPPTPCPLPVALPSLCLPFWVSRPVRSCPLGPCLLSRDCLPPGFPTYSTAST